MLFSSLVLVAVAPAETDSYVLTNRPLCTTSWQILSPSLTHLLLPWISQERAVGAHRAAKLGAPLAGWQPHPAQPSPGFIASPCIICLIPVSEKGGCAESLHMAGRTKPHPRYAKVQNICLNLSGPQRCALAASQDLLLVFAMNLAHREQRGEFDGVKKHRSLCGSQDILDRMQPCWCQSLRRTEEPLVSHLVLVMQMS